MAETELSEFDPERMMMSAREEEALFARGEDDFLIRQERATREQFRELIELTIDGEKLTVPRAMPLTDAQGNEIRGNDGNVIPRRTTIYDAAARLWQGSDLQQRIPVLCHQEHLDPVAVCRMCSVHISSVRKSTGKMSPGRKLVPACQHEVQPNMVVTTRACPKAVEAQYPFVAQVETATRLLAELLAADHLPVSNPREDRFRNELREVAELVALPFNRLTRNPGLGEITTDDDRNTCCHSKSRPVERKSLPMLPYSSRSIQVDHDLCILCDRCVRSCRDVRPFAVIGHTGKGYRTRISFDLDKVMNDSSCVQCGECMSSCPTGALTMERRVNPLGSWPDADKLERQARLDHSDYRPSEEDKRHSHPFLTVYNDPAIPLPGEFPSAQVLRGVRLRYNDGGTERSFEPFRDIPLPYLRWNEGGVRRRSVAAGDILCRQGEFGASAFLLDSGEFEIQISGVAPFRLDHKALILGELACRTNRPRRANIVASKPGVIYEVRRNLLIMLQRTATGRAVLDPIYRRQSIENCLRTGALFSGLNDEQRLRVLAELLPHAELRSVRPGETVVQQGDFIGTASENRFHGDFYFVRVGALKVTQRDFGSERVVAQLQEQVSEETTGRETRCRSRNHFGEIPLLADRDAIRSLLPRGFEMGRRSATVTALDDVELVRIPGGVFRDLCSKYADVEAALVQGCVAMLQADREASQPAATDRLGTYLDQGYFQGRSLLVLDLERCTRCDECTKACADAHGGPRAERTSRLLREGPRFGKFLVATSCRSCLTPYCMDECPVDSIHRPMRSSEIRIESHCIGCGLCAFNCPYESIQMISLGDTQGRQRTASVVQKAVNCDLCQGLVPRGAEPFCVSACPHHAAFRWSGEDLLQRVAGK